MSHELFDVQSDYFRFTGERLCDDCGDLSDRGRLGQPFPNEGGHLIQGVDGIEVAELVADRNQHGFLGNFSRHEVRTATITSRIGSVPHGA